MTTLTLTLDDEAAAAAQRIAEQTHTTVESLCGEYLKTLAAKTQADRDRAADELMETIRRLSRPMGGKGWTNRDELYDR